MIEKIEEKQVWGMGNQEFLSGSINMKMFIRHQEEIF